MDSAQEHMWQGIVASGTMVRHCLETAITSRTLRNATRVSSESFCDPDCGRTVIHPLFRRFQIPATGILNVNLKNHGVPQLSRQSIVSLLLIITSQPPPPLGHAVLYILCLDSKSLVTHIYLIMSCYMRTCSSQNKNALMTHQALRRIPFALSDSVAT